MRKRRGSESRFTSKTAIDQTANPTGQFPLTAKLREFMERSLAEFCPFAVLLDTVHRDEMAFIVALDIDCNGYKKALGF